ncbi:type II toxin-antitoxin system MqsA family antitoxin [Eshraghiella crossota]|uniref:type II toxin-antitoxin system MqsA family antitoxin n=1 Tax=Lachnospiraceae TaxID=186803 RepID=UPI003F813892
MKCLSCKSGNMEESTTTYTAVLKNCILIIKNVPCMKCEQCGEVLYNTDILEKIDYIIAMAEKMASEVSIIDYSKVA